MSLGRIIDGIKYMYVMNDNEFKKKSLYDNIYFTLRDIFANADSVDTISTANRFNGCLTNNIFFEDRTNTFEYSNELKDKKFLKSIQTWLKYLNIHYFEFFEPNDDEEIDMKKYMKWDDWWEQFVELRNVIDNY